MAKSKFHRVATEGATADGRRIERKDIQDMAATYNRTTYAARVNMEHFRGLTADGPFKSYGDVLALKTEEIDLNVGGKIEKRLALYAQIEPTADLIDINGKKQKLYTSVEIMPDFAGSGKSYLYGLAVTDSPASLGTEVLEFAAKAQVNPFAARKTDPKTLFVASEEFKLELEDEPTVSPAQTEASGLLKAASDFFTSLAKPAAPEPAPAPAPAPAAPASEFSQMLQGLQSLSLAMTAQATATNEAITAIRQEVSDFKAQVEKTPATTYTQRPQSTGGDTALKAVC